ncbi:MAG TPA: DUF305 domain-containing protein [Pseudonocardia sp.]
MDDPPPVDGTDVREPRWVRPFVIAAAALVLLLVGATGGLLISRSGQAEMPAADSVDVGFLQDMSVHHQQAVEMASWERDHTTDPQLRQLAYDIESTQTGQVGRMQGWLELWGASAQPVGRPYMTWMAASPTGAHDHGAGVAAGAPTMPGMASADELKKLRAASGKNLDVSFLQLMLRHHQGGATMLSDAAQNASKEPVRNLAAQMLGAQTAEAEYLEQLLTARGGTPLPSS